VFNKKPVKIFAVAAAFLLIATSSHAQGVTVRNLTPRSQGLIASVFTATEGFPATAPAAASPMRLRQRVSDERSNTSLCRKLLTQNAMKLALSAALITPIDFSSSSGMMACRMVSRSLIASGAASIARSCMSLKLFVAIWIGNDGADHIEEVFCSGALEPYVESLIQAVMKLCLEVVNFLQQLVLV